MVPVVQPSLFDLFDESGLESPTLPDFNGTSGVVEQFPGATIGVFDLHHALGAVGPAFAVHPDREDWPPRVSWNPLLPALEIVCRSASGNPHTAARLEREVIDILTARSQEDADTAVETLRSEYANPLFQRLISRLTQWPTEPGVASRRWGQDRCADAVRARWIAKWTGDGHSKRVWSVGFSWVGSLRWVGEQLPQQRISRASPGRLRFFGAAVASVHGWHAAVEQIAGLALELHGLDAEVCRWTSALALRAVLSDHVDETVLSALVPRAALWLSTEGNQHPVPPAQIALRRLVDASRHGPALLLLARLVSTRFRLAVRMMKPSVPGRRGSSEQSEESRLDAMFDAPPPMLRGAWFHWGRRPDILEFDYEGLENILTQYLGTGDPQIVWPILIDRHMLAAILFAISGHTLSARTQLGTRPERDRWSEAEAVLRRTMARRSAMPGPLWEWAGRQVEDPEIERMLASLMQTPDPSVETATPVSVLRDQSSWALDLNRAGKGAEFRALRRVFDRPDLLRLHEPYWILQAHHRRSLLLTIASLARSNTSIGELPWRQVAEDVAREILES